MSKRNFLYLRLSKADLSVEGKLCDESNSIVNQRLLLRSYLNNSPELTDSFEELIDDGYSGMDFERPAMKQLLELVEQNQVQTIIVKDLSRLGRSYLDTGFYQEIFFPLHDVRLIAVNDDYDSANKDTFDNLLEWRIKNLQNYFYSVDLSHKVNSSFEIIRRNGQHLGQIPYGYVKGNTKNQIAVDAEAAEIVRLIFHLVTCKSMKISDIARYLNEKSIPTPSQLKQSRGVNCRVRNFWSYNAVYYIVTNRIYTGYLDFCKFRPKEIGSKQFNMIPREEREIVYGQHTPLVSVETYEQAQKAIHQINKNKSKKQALGKNPTHHILRGYLVCRCCGNKLVYRKRWGSIYVCPYRSVHVGSDCERVSCNAYQIEQVILHSIQNMIALSEVPQFQCKKQLDGDMEVIQRYSKQIRVLQKKSEKFDDKRITLYDSYIEQRISKEEFLQEKNLINQKQQHISDEIDSLTAQMTLIRQKVVQYQTQNNGETIDADQLSPDLLKTMVRKVIISADGTAEINPLC